MAFEGVDIDFDPLTEEGRTDINDVVENEYDSLLPKDGEAENSIFSRFKRRFGWSGARYAINRFNKSFRIRNNDNSMPQYMELNQMDDVNTLEKREERINEAANDLSDVYPEWNPSNSDFLFTIDEYGRVEVRLKTKGSKTYHLFDGKWTDGTPPRTILDKLGMTADDLKENTDGKDELDAHYPENNMNREHGYNFRYNDGNLEVTHTKLGKWYQVFNAKNEISGKLPKTITDRLGPTAVAIADEKTAKIITVDKKIERSDVGEASTEKKVNEYLAKREQDRSDLKDMRKRVTDNEELIGSDEDIDNERHVALLEENDRLIRSIAAREDELEVLEGLVKTSEETLSKAREDNRSLQKTRDGLVNEREVVEEKLPLKERIKQIIKRHGLTVTGIVLAVGTIIGVIINSLQSGLSAAAKGTGNALKALGKKLAAILPGMVGAIASFIFKSAGEVVSFLGKHVWALIIGVVVLMVSQLQKRVNKK